MKIRPLPNRRERGTGLRDRDFFCLISPSSCRYQLVRKTSFSLWPFFPSREFAATIAIDHVASKADLWEVANILTRTRMDRYYVVYNLGDFPRGQGKSRFLNCFVPRISWFSRIFVMWIRTEIASLTLLFETDRPKFDHSHRRCID